MPIAVPSDHQTYAWMTCGVLSFGWPGIGVPSLIPVCQATQAVFTLLEEWHAHKHGRHPARAFDFDLLLRYCVMGLRSALASGFKKVTGVVLARPTSARVTFKVSRTCPDVHAVQSIALCD